MRRLAVAILAAALTAASLIPFAPPKPAPAMAGDCWTESQACKVCGQIPDGVKDHSACIALYNSCKTSEVETLASVPRVDVLLQTPEPSAPGSLSQVVPIVEPVVRVVPDSDIPFKVPIA